MTQRPNIVLILADDMGYGDLSCLNENSGIDTPHMDRLAAEGMAFTDAHASSSVCTPSRYGILTGRYAWRGPLQRWVLGPLEAPLIEENVLTLPGFLRGQGYYTACVGKWHLGMDWPFEAKPTTADLNWDSTEVVEAANNIDYASPIENGPTERGFDTYFGVDVPNFPPYCFIEGDKTIGQPDRPKPESMFGMPGPMVEGWTLEEILPELTRRAVATIDEHAQTETPFFLYFSLTAPHTPIAPTPQFQGKSRAGVYGDFVMQVDDTVGQVAAALKRNGLTENTLLIVASDNGSPGRDGSLEAPGTVIETFGHNPSWILRGMKADTWDGGHRIPLIAHWPGKVPTGSTCHEMVCLMDLMATCAELINEPLPDGSAEDSISILAYLMGDDVDGPLRTQLVHHGVDGLYGVREGPWKLIMGTGSGGFSPDPEVGIYDPPQQLYHMQDDIREQHNRYFEEPDIVKRLTEVFAAHKRSPTR